MRMNAASTGAHEVSHVSSLTSQRSDGEIHCPTADVPQKHGTVWTDDEEKRLAALCRSEHWVGWERVGTELGRKLSACRGKWHRMGLDRTEMACQDNPMREERTKKVRREHQQAAATRDRYARAWTEAEDAQLIELSQYRASRRQTWEDIAQALVERTGGACRARYAHLVGKTEKVHTPRHPGPWNEAEDTELTQSRTNGMA
jgi:hypothetical protein